MILFDVLLIHMRNRSLFPGVVFLQQVSCIFYLSLVYYCLGYLFASFVYIHLLDIVLLSIFIASFASSSVAKQAVLILPFLPCLSCLTLILFISPYFTLSSSFLSLCSIIWFLFRSIIYTIDLQHIYYRSMIYNMISFVIFYFMFFRSTSMVQSSFVLWYRFQLFSVPKIAVI